MSEVVIEMTFIKKTMTILKNSKIDLRIFCVCYMHNMLSHTWHTLHVTTGVPPDTVVYDGGGTSSTEVTTSPPGGGTVPSPAFTAAWSMLDLKPWLEDVDSVKKNKKNKHFFNFCIN